MITPLSAVSAISLISRTPGSPCAWVINFAKIYRCIERKVALSDLILDPLVY